MRGERPEVVGMGSEPPIDFGGGRAGNQLHATSCARAPVVSKPHFSRTSSAGWTVSSY